MLTKVHRIIPSLMPEQEIVVPPLLSPSAPTASTAWVLRAPYGSSRFDTRQHRVKRHRGTLKLCHSTSVVCFSQGPLDSGYAATVHARCGRCAIWLSRSVSDWLRRANRNASGLQAASEVHAWRRVQSDLKRAAFILFGKKSCWL